MQYLTVVLTMNYHYRVEFSDDDDQQGRFLAIIKRTLGVQPKVRTISHVLLEHQGELNGIELSRTVERYLYSDLVVDTTDEVALKICDECYKHHVDISISNTSCIRRGLVEPVIEIRLLNSKLSDMTGDDAMPRIIDIMKSNRSHLNNKEDAEDDE